MKLLSLKLENFMGVKAFDFAPLGHSVTVLGANDSGKSTLETAYWWLLTGKNAEQSTDFDVYPYGAPEGVEASVTGEFEDDNGDTFTLTRTYKREFTRRKGDAESVFKGNKTSYLINGVPETQTKFKAFVAEHIAPEDKLLVLGKLHYFATDMRWDARRAVLLDVFAPHLSDADIIKAHEELAPLGGWIGAMTTVDDMARQAKAKRRELNAELNEIPARIDEAERSKPILPPESERPGTAALMKEKMKLVSELEGYKANADAATLRTRIAEQKAKAAEAKAAYIKDSTAGSTTISRQAETLRERIRRAEEKQMQLERDYKANVSLKESFEKELNELRKRAVDNHNEQFPTDQTICPTCGQILPKERLEDLKAEFNTRKARRSDEITKKGLELKALCESTAQRVNEFAAELKDIEMHLQSDNEMLRGLTASIVTPSAWETTVDAMAYDTELHELEAKLTKAEQTTDERYFAAQKRMDELNAQLASGDTRAAVEAQIKALDKRIEELKAHETYLGRQLAETDQRITLAERFVQLQAADIEDKINAGFKRVRWVMFDRQVNGGIAPCCRATVQSNKEDVYTAYESNTNTARQYNAGLDIIAALSEAMGLHLPVWVDNAESCTKLDSIANQMIRLQVAAEHKKIKVEADK